MRLVTFNLLHGRSTHDGTVDAARLAAAVTALDADVLALQEVDRAQSRSGHLDLTTIAAQALDAPTHRFVAAVVGTPGEGFRPGTHDEPRVLLAAVLQTPTGPLTAGVTHLSFLPGWNARQLRQAVRALRALPPPRVLLGDLNLPAGVAGLVSRWRPLGRRATYPAAHPRVQLDHVLADRHGSSLSRVASVGTPRSAISDHRPLVVDLA